MRVLCQDLSSWQPIFVEQRDAMCLELHKLFFSLQFSEHRYTVAMLVFCWHYTPRLRRHGNLLGMSTEGGEMSHQVAKKFSGKEPSYRRPFCPPALVSFMRWAVMKVLLWSEGLRLPQFWCKREPTMPHQH